MSLSRGRNIVIVAGIIAVIVAGVWWMRRTRPEITGRVVLRGTPPPEIKIPLDAASAKLRPNGLTTRHYLVSSNGGLANVFVSIKARLSNHISPSTSAPVVMGFRGACIEPFVIAVPTNQIVRFQNGDPLLHNVHATPRANGNREFNFAMPTQTPGVSEPWYKALYRRFVLRRPPPSKGIDKAFPVAESFVRLKCEVHPWEFGYICVADNPFFAVTDADGKFEFPPGLPPGRYSIEAQHLKAGTATQEVVIAAGEKKRIEFSLDVPATGTRPTILPR